MNTYLILRRNGWSTPETLEKAAGRSSRVAIEEMADRVAWIRSYVVKETDDSLGAFCIYQGTDPESVVEHARRAGLPCDEIIPVVETVVINDDPVAVA